jgi:hypothetical protein
MSKLPKDKRDKIILIGMGTAVACAAVWFLLINAQRATLERVRKEAVKSREQLATGEKTLKSQVAVNDEFEAASQALRKRESEMASPSDMFLWHITTLNSFRAPYKVEIPQFGKDLPGEVNCFPKFPYHAASFTVRGTATYHDFGKFLADFENSFPYIRVQNIELDPAAADMVHGNEGKEKSKEVREQLNFKMELLTLVRPNAI